MGGIMQLAAYGAQDVYLTGNPEITFFKAVHRRHTNFAMEQIEQSFNGTVEAGARASCTISRNGDLVGDCVLEMNICCFQNDQYYDGESLISSVELEIGGQIIDKHDSYWFRVYDELCRNETEKHAYLREASNYNNSIGAPGATRGAPTTTGRVLLPLIFTFNRHPGVYLPLIALQHQEVRILFAFNSTVALPNRVVNFPPAAGDQGATLYANYIFLDTAERRSVAQNKHEYLIDQVQIQNESFVTVTAPTQIYILNFNSPIKYLAWFVCSHFDGIRDRGNFTAAGNGIPTYNTINTSNSGVFGDAMWMSGAGNVGSKAAPQIAENNASFISSAKLTLNGISRFPERGGNYFQRYQPAEHFHTRPVNGIYCYSFALNPVEEQPSGTCNFSRIDNATLLINSGTTTATQDKLKIYAVNYNILRVQSGMAALAFNN